MKRQVSSKPKNNLWREFLLGWRLMWQYIARGRKWTLGLTTLLVAVAFINLAFASSLLTGITSAIEHQVKSLMVGEVYLDVAKSDEFITQPDEKIARIKQIDGVTAADKILANPSRLTFGDEYTQTSINVVDPATFKQTLEVADHITEGSFLAQDDEIVLGSRLLEKGALEDVKIGDTVTMKINGKSFDVKVGGVAQTKYIYADSEAFISRELWRKIAGEVREDLVAAESAARSDATLDALAQMLPPAAAEQLKDKMSGQSDLLLKQQRAVAAQFAGADDASLIAVRVAKGKEASVQQAIEELSYSGLKVHNWHDSAGFMDTIASSFSSLDAIMLMVGIIIAAVTIFIVIYVDIINKRRQIGIQRALGVKPRVIVFSYILLALFYAICGVAVGLAIFFGGLVQYFLAHPFSLPIADVTLSVSWPELLIRAEIILVVAIVSGAIPAIMASRMKMLEAILGRG